jgi:heme exporter protein B
LKEIYHLIAKEFTLEWRQKYAISGVLLYVGSTIYTVFISYGLKTGAITQQTWNALFWVVLLFAAVNALTKSFTQESKNRNLYYYTIASPQSIIVSKTIYNFLVMLLISFLCWLVFTLLIGDGVTDNLLFFVTLIIGSMSLATSLTLISGISSNTSNPATMMAILGFPVIIPVLLLLIKISKHAIMGLEQSLVYDELITLLAINLIVVALSYILFPFIWKA